MPTRAEVIAGIYGAYRLARADAGAMSYFDTTLDGFWKSFFAAAVVAPFYLLLLVLRLATAQTGVLDPLRFFTAEAIGYVIAWVAFPLIMIPLSEALDRRDHYFRYLVAYNWAAVIQNAIYLPLGFLILSGLVPFGLAVLLELAAIGAILAYAWFIARTALDIPGLTAAGLVFIDFVVGFAINKVTGVLS
ncbi:MAG: hypothetical protein H6907_15515 [Hyphomicrobiales bacterium]|nr:hypothetical protein [Hyphomicrobiales bacterium]